MAPFASELNDMRRTLLCLTLLLCSSLCVQAQDNKSLITVSGQAEIGVTPDLAVFSLRVVTLDKDLARAKALNDESVKKTLALAGNYQIPPEDVQTNYIGVETREVDDDDDDKPPVFLGYEISKKIVLTLRDMSRIESLLSDLIKAGVNRVEGIDFRTTQIRQHKDRARQMAIRAAQEKALALTKEIGQTIGKAHSITEEGGGGGASASSNNYISNARGTLSGDYSDAEGTIAIGQILVIARVTVSFELK
jgi:uncharacterized protein